MKTVRLPSGETLSALGIGTWRMGEHSPERSEEIATLRLAIDLGVTVIDTAEMYGAGATEALVGEAIADRRERVFLVSKFYPQHASRRELARACEGSLRRLKTDRIDLYLLHWRGHTPLAETLEACLQLHQQGKIRHFGVSNFDIEDLHELSATPSACMVATNQVLYNLMRRGAEWELLGWLAARRIPLMAYSPLEQGRLLRHRPLTEFARRRGLTAAQVALAWVLAQDGVLAIPKSAHRARLKENWAALEHPLTPGDQAELDRLFPPPQGPSPLAML